MNYNELKVARIRRALTSKDIAEKLNWTPAVYSYKENGVRRISVEEAQKIAEVLKLSPAEILLIFFDINVNANGNFSLQQTE
ncbi:MAG: helix-turn-helix transcriptional regulator [Selenomonadaceae bacterium]|nr:helix-turn-helix transcriptional regulator [Selenomonadaceae bacterium]